MSGGAFGYMQYQIDDMARRTDVLLATVAITEHETDWAVSGDTTPDAAAKRIYDLWVHVFTTIYEGEHTDCPEWLRYCTCPASKWAAH